MCPSVLVYVNFSFSHKCRGLGASSWLQSHALCENAHHMLITALHSGQLPPSSAIRCAQFSQNLACPQGTKAKPSIGANKHTCTSQHRNGVSAAAGAPGTDAAADALAAVGVNCSSLSSSELSACWLGCSASVWAPTAWLTARRNCNVSYAPLC